MVATGGSRGSGQCYGAFELKGGALMVMAVAKFYGNSPPTDIAIVGGTGVYAGATGSIHSVSTGESTSADTVALTWVS